MARAPLLQLSGISLTFGGNPVFDDLSLTVQPGDRIALVGRNGSGKSTLMKVMAGLVEADSGTRVVPPGVTVGYMEQEPDLSRFATLGDFAASELPDGMEYRLAVVAEGLKFNPTTPIATASGGERRRAALAKLLAEAPELMLLDEPTNHLDIQAIEWLEAELSTTRTAFVLISHDRAFLRALSRTTLWIDRGEVRRREAGFEGFEDWRETVWAEEDEARHKLDRKIKHEAKWAVEGISARRKRNMGRVRALQALRAERKSQIRRQGTAAFALDSGPTSGKKVIEATGLTKTFGDKLIVKDFSLRVLRGDRVAFVGPNGVGKTTLLKMLTGEVEPDSGTVVLGTNLEIAVFDQTRTRLDLDASLWDNLTVDPLMRVSGSSDQVMVRGTAKHVVAYLKDFLFQEAQARAPVRSLSGGERARLLLAKLMAQPSNLLILDEPTNDLDVETLDLSWTSRRTIWMSRRWTSCKTSLATMTGRSCWSAMIAISSTAWQPPRLRCPAMAGRPSIPAVGRIMSASVQTPRKRSHQRPRNPRLQVRPETRPPAPPACPSPNASALMTFRPSSPSWRPRFPSCPSFWPTRTFSPVNQ